jgi:LuxR family maltose regulon positive regulatory protein
MWSVGDDIIGLPGRSWGVPRPLDVELPRLRLVHRLRERWTRPVTLVVAGPGFGKTTALAQAVRANLFEPCGIDAWVSCEADHEDAGRLARSILDALDGCGDHSRTRPGARDVLDALIRCAPLDVCLLLDDVHQVPAGSPGSALLAEVVRALPDTAHLVLSGRLAPDIPLARRQAAGQVAGIGAADLAFTDVETTALARRFGREIAVTEQLHGWPALVRLALAAGPSASWRYAREEVLNGLPDRLRRALAALAALGSATAAELAKVVGEPVPPEDLVRRIPLVDRLDDGRYRAHDLWTDPVARTVPGHQLRVLRARAVEVLSARGELARAGHVACRAHDWELLARLAVDLVRSTLSTLPRATTERWLAAVPPEMADEPAFLLLRAAGMHARDFTDPSIDRLVDDACQGMLEAGNQEDAAVALGQAVITAHSRGDLVRLAAVAERAGRLDMSGSPVLRLLRHSAAAVLAELAGDPEAALTELAHAPVHEVPRVLAMSALRFHIHCLDMCGRGREAAELAERMLGDVSDDLVRHHAAAARWFDGNPEDLERLRRQPEPATDAGDAVDSTAREAFVSWALQAVMAASWGDCVSWPPRLCGDLTTQDNARDAVLACAAQAAVAVARGEEDSARETYARHLASWPTDIRLAERHLRRFLALGYVLSDRLRAQWDSTDLGPSHRVARTAARAVVDARDGDLAPAAQLPDAHALCFLPLPWSVELAARLAGANHSRGLKLGGWLADTVGPAVHRQFRDLARTSTDAAVAGGAARLLAALPTPPDHRLGIEVIGPMRLATDGVPVDAPQLRRTRVRQLLGLLTLRPVLKREQAMDLLWPGLDPARAARNLRVTLTHLRRLLEPRRANGAASHWLRCDGDAIRLVGSESLSVDLWTFHDLGDRVDQARAAGDIDRAAQLLGQAVALWRGDPLHDLHDLRDAAVVAELDQVRTRHVHNLLALGELRLVVADAAEAWWLADRALTLEPFEPRGHQLALAAALRGRAPERVAATRERVLSCLRQLGVAPDPATSILLRQAFARPEAPSGRATPRAPVRRS